MTQEDKELLLKDLCGRLSYGIKVSTPNKKICKIYTVPCESGALVVDEAGTENCKIENIKPYLFPLLSMSKEQRLECSFVIHLDMSWLDINLETDQFTMITYHTMDFFNRNHLDHRSLIEKGLAIDATNLGIY